MKTAFRAKVIFESDRLTEDVDNAHCSDEVFSIYKMINIINSQKITIECIGDQFTNNVEPVIIIRQK